MSILEVQTHGNEYRFLVMHNLLRLFPEKGVDIEPVLLLAPKSRNTTQQIRMRTFPSRFVVSATDVLVT